MIVTVALLMLFVLAIFAIVIESGLVWTQRRDLQNDVDAAALAGAQELDGTTASEGPAIAAAEEYAAKNLDLDQPPEIEVFDNFTKIRVRSVKNSGTVFSGSFSFGDPEISADATAGIAAPIFGGPGVVPLAIDEGSVPPVGQVVTIKVSSGNGQSQWASGNFGFIDLGSGAKALCNYMVGGSPHSVTDPQDSQPGNVSKMANNNCVPRRMDAAQGFGCYTWNQVTETVNGEVRIRDECNPLIGAPKGAYAPYPDAQPTSVIVFPLVKTWNGCNGKCPLDVVGDEEDPRTFVFFVVDPATVDEVSGVTGSPTCNKDGGGGQCEIRGSFVLNHGFTISTDFDEPTGKFDLGSSLFKIIQLIE